MKKQQYISLAIGLATITTLALAVPALAQTAPTGTATVQAGWAGHGRSGGMMGMPQPAVFGKVSAVSGNSITVTSQTFGKASTTPTTGTVYTVDATNAKVTKGTTTSSVSAIAVGDTIVVSGTVSGTNVVATTIRDGVGMMRPNTSTKTPVTPVITGNGEPVIAGSISAINGNTLTVTNKSNITYTVDATNAKIAEGNTVTSLSNLKVNDSVVVQGTVNGTSVTASSVIDQTPSSTTQKSPKGIFGGITQFFSHLFGF